MRYGGFLIVGAPVLLLGMSKGLYIKAMRDPAPTKILDLPQISQIVPLEMHDILVLVAGEPLLLLFKVDTYLLFPQVTRHMRIIYQSLPITSLEKVVSRGCCSGVVSAVSQLGTVEEDGF